MICEEEKSKHRGGRPTKAVKRESVTGVRFTKSEYFIVKQKAVKVGLGITLYIRQMALHGEVRMRMSEEERRAVRQLIGMNNNLNQLTKRAHQEGILTAMLLFENYRTALDQLLNQFKK